MKKLKQIIILISVILVIVSCSKHFKDTEHVNKQLVSQLLTLDNINKQIIAYRTLNEYEKAYIWKQKLSAWIQSENLLNEQADLVQELINNITPEVFIMGSKENLYFKNFYSKNWETRAFKVISVENTFKMVETIRAKKNSNIIMSVKPAQYNVNSSISPDLYALPDCSCNSANSCGSMYCDCSTASSHCTASTWGCGFLWLSSCGGWCFCGGA